MIVTYTVAAPIWIGHPPHQQASCTSQEDLNFACQTPKITAVYYKLVKDREARITLHQVLEFKDSQRLVKKLKNEVDTSDVYSEYCCKLIYKLKLVSFMRDGYLGQNSIVNHNKKLPLNLSPVRSASYGAGPIGRKFQWLEIEKILSENVIEPAQTELAAPINLAPKKMDLYIPVLTIEKSTN